jgi:hypothetical protein
LWLCLNNCCSHIVFKDFISKWPYIFYLIRKITIAQWLKMGQGLFFSFFSTVQIKKVKFPLGVELPQVLDLEPCSSFFYIYLFTLVYINCTKGCHCAISVCACSVL